MKYVDVILGEESKEAFGVVSRQLGVDSFVHVTSFGKKGRIQRCSGLFIGKARDIQKASGYGVPVFARVNDRVLFDRRYTGKAPLVVFELEQIEPYDGVHYRYSGLNQVLCKLAHDHNIILGISFSQLLRLPARKYATVLGRMIQNVTLARKFGMRIKLGSFARDPWEMRAARDMASFGALLGMHPSEVRKALALQVGEPC